MKKFILGVITAFVGIGVCKKMYDQGYDDATKDIKTEEKNSSKDKKAK